MQAQVFEASAVRYLAIRRTGKCSSCDSLMLAMLANDGGFVDCAKAGDLVESSTRQQQGCAVDFLHSCQLRRWVSLEVPEGGYGGQSGLWWQQAKVVWLAKRLEEGRSGLGEILQRSAHFHTYSTVRSVKS